MPLWPANERLEADHLCSGRTIFAQTCMVRGDQLCMHKWSGRTVFARTIGALTEPSLIIDEKTCMITNKLYIMCPRTTCDHMSDQQWTAVGMAKKKNYKFRYKTKVTA